MAPKCSCLWMESIYTCVQCRVISVTASFCYCYVLASITNHPRAEDKEKLPHFPNYFWNTWRSKGQILLHTHQPYTSGVAVLQESRLACAGFTERFWRKLFDSQVTPVYLKCYRERKKNQNQILLILGKKSPNSAVTGLSATGDLFNNKHVFLHWLYLLYLCAPMKLHLLPSLKGPCVLPL